MILKVKIQSWENVYFFADNPNSMWQIWKELFLQVLDKHAPLQSKKIKSKKLPWITNHIKQMIITRDKLKRRAIVTKLKTGQEGLSITPIKFLLHESQNPKVA